MPACRSSLLLTTLLCLLAGYASAGDIRHSIVTAKDGVPLQVVSTGSPTAPGILFLHGWSLGSSSWQQQLTSSLAEQYHLVAMDFRGHGGSGKPWTPESYATSQVWADDIATVIEQSGLDKPVIVAWSYGGHVTMDYIRHFPLETLSGIVFVGSSGGMLPFPPPDADTAADFARMGALAMSPNSADRLAAAREFVAGMTQTELPAAIADREVATVLMLPPYARTLMQTRPLDNSDLVDKLQLPVLFLLGSEERTATGSDIRGLSARIPGSRVQTYPDTGHMPFIEQQDRFNADLSAFVLNAFEERVTEPGVDSTGAQ